MMTTRRPVNFALAGLLAAVNLVGSGLLMQAAPPAGPHTSPALMARDSGAKAAEFVDACLIKQSVKLFGDQQLIVSRIGIKSTNAKSTVCFVMTPPFDTVTMYNRRNQVFFQTSVKTFRCPVQKTFALFNDWMLGESPMDKIGTGSLNGFNVVKYRTTKAFTRKQLNLRKTDHVPSSNPSVIDSQSTDEFKLPPGAGLGLCRLYGVPIVPGIPIRVDCKDTDSTPSVFMESSKGIKTRVTTADFDMPPGYKRVKNVEELNQSNDTEDAMQLFGR